VPVKPQSSKKHKEKLEKVYFACEEENESGIYYEFN
jgi:hypothetical protein